MLGLYFLKIKEEAHKRWVQMFYLKHFCTTLHKTRPRTAPGPPELWQHTEQLEGSWRHGQTSEAALNDLHCSATALLPATHFPPNWLNELPKNNPCNFTLTMLNNQC